MNTNPLMDLIPSAHQDPVYGDIEGSLKSWRAAWEAITEEVEAMRIAALHRAGQAQSELAIELVADLEVERFTVAEQKLRMAEIERRIKELEADGAKLKAVEVIAHDTCCELTHERDHALSTLDQLRAITERQADLYPTGHVTCRIIDRRWHLRLWRDMAHNSPVSGNSLPEVADVAAKLLGIKRYAVHYAGYITHAWAITPQGAKDVVVRQLLAKGWGDVSEEEGLVVAEVQP